MNRLMKSFLRRFSPITLSLLTAAGVSLSGARAQIVTLHDGNSSASVDLGSQAGMYQWLINGQNQLSQQWFWYRVGNDASGQHSIDTIGGLTHAENANTVDATYTAPNFSIELIYTLNGGAAGGSD